jgi:zinc-binding alcohol dehydrogenase family protein
LADAAVRVPGAPSGRDLLVEVRAVAVNPVDVKVKAGGGHGSGGRVLGWEASGIVLDVGPMAELFAPGDPVWWAGALDRPGANAALELVDERLVGRKPTSLTHAEAAGLPLTGLTAWEALFDKLKLGSESEGVLLVLGGAGGVGSVLIQLAKALTGLRVIASASRPESRAWVTELGADAVVDHFAPDLAAQIRELAPGGVDYVFTPYTSGRVGLFAEVLRPFGEVVAIDDESAVDLYSLKSKAISWHWEFMFARSLHGASDMARQHEILDALAGLVDSGRLRSTVTNVLEGLTAANLRLAHELVETGRSVGKTVITLPELAPGA